MESSGTPVASATAQKSAVPLVAGIYLIIAGVLGLAWWGLVVAGGGAISGYIGSVPGMEIVTGVLLVCGAIGIIFSIIALLGGVMSVQRKSWRLLLIGSIIGLLSIGWIIGSILSLVAIHLIAISRKEYA